jgi:hypothetical protein
VRLLKPVFQFIVEVVDGSNGDEMSAPLRTIVLFSSHPLAFQPSTERKARNEVILAGREPREADAGNADEARFLGNDLNAAEGAQDVDELPGVNECLCPKRPRSAPPARSEF